MKRVNKTMAIISGSLLLMASMGMSIASAQKSVNNGDFDAYVIDKEPLAQAQLDQVLAPIALYPDSLLSQILVAATYPLEVVQATRWRQANQLLTEKQVLAAIEDKQWDPSVKALTPFTDLITRLSKDLDWLQQLGDAFLQNEEQVLASIQDLRQKARDHGSIADNDYYDVVEDGDDIIIKSTSREIVYVPYYDSRLVYGPWGWNDYQPVYWHHPSNYRLHAGFYWSDHYFIRPTIFFGGFHWRSRNLVVNHHFYDRPYRQSNRYRNVRVSNYRHWNHNPVHRRGVRYTRNGGKDSAYRNQYNSRLRVNREARQRPQERRRVDNRVVSSNPRNQDNIRRTERSRAQQQGQNPRRNEQSANRPARNDANASRANNARSAPVANNSPTRSTNPRQNNSNTNNASNTSNDARYNRSATRNAPSSKQRFRTSNRRSHKQPN